MSRDPQNKLISRAKNHTYVAYDMCLDFLRLIETEKVGGAIVFLREKTCCNQISNLYSA